MRTTQRQVQLLPSAKDYINGLSPAEQGSVAADIKTMRYRGIEYAEKAYKTIKRHFSKRNKLPIKKTDT